MKGKYDMKKNKKIIGISLALVLAVGSIPMTALAEADTTPINLEETVEEKGIFTIFNGKVTSIDKRNGETVIRLESQDKGELDLRVTDITVLSNENGVISADKVKKGDAITAYYVEPMIMTLQYPPMVEASVLVTLPEDGIKNVSVNVFNKNNLANDNSLKLNIGDKTEIVTPDGKAYEGSIEGKVLMVYYTIQTFSLPPQTNPEKIIVLENMKTQEIKQPENLPQDSFDLSDVSKLPIFVNEKHLENAKAYKKDDVIMVPLRDVATAFGFDVEWDSNLRKVRVGAAITLSVGVNEYTIGRAMPMELEFAPEIKDNLTYVPVSFVTDMMGKNFSVLEGTLDFFD